MHSATLIDLPSCLVAQLVGGSLCRVLLPAMLIARSWQQRMLHQKERADPASFVGKVARQNGPSACWSGLGIDGPEQLAVLIALPTSTAWPPGSRCDVPSPASDMEEGARWQCCLRKRLGQRSKHNFSWSMRYPAALAGPAIICLQLTVTDGLLHRS